MGVEWKLSAVAIGGVKGDGRVSEQRNNSPVTAKLCGARAPPPTAPFSIPYLA